MRIVNDLFYPENSATLCPYSIDEIHEIGSNSPEDTYPAYQYDTDHFHEPLRENCWFERGMPNRVIDVIGNILAIPSKILLWNSKFHSNHISQETEEILKCYMRDNRLQHVKVYLNKYDPVDVMKRAFTNPRLHTATKCIFWPLIVLSSLMPTRLLFGDHYNYFAEALVLVSDDPVIALHEAGHAKDFARRNSPFFYSLLGLIPFGGLYHETQASLDPIAYLQAKRFTKLVPSAIETLTPAFASHVARSALAVFGLILKLPFTPIALTKAVTWLRDPFIKITNSTLIKISFILDKFPPFMSRFKTITIALSHVIARTCSAWYSRQQHLAK